MIISGKTARLGALLGAGMIALVVLFSIEPEPDPRTESGPPWASRYPELLDVDAGLCERARVALRRDIDEMEASFGAMDELLQRTGTLLEEFGQNGEAGPLALLALLTTSTAPAQAPPFSPALAAASTWALASQPLSMKLSMALWVVKTKMPRKSLTPSPIPKPPEAIFM